MKNNNFKTTYLHIMKRENKNIKKTIIDDSASKIIKMNKNSLDPFIDT